MVTKKARSIAGYIALIPVVAGMAYFLIDSRFVSHAEAAPTERAVRTLQSEVVGLRKDTDVQYSRVICELEAIRKDDNRVCQ